MQILPDANKVASSLQVSSSSCHVRLPLPLRPSTVDDLRFRSLGFHWLAIGRGQDL